MIAKKGRPAGTSEPEKLPSGRYRARVTGPDGKRHPAPVTFDDLRTARLWIAKESRRIEDDPEGWLPPKERIAALNAVAAMPTFGEYAHRWIENRRVKGKPLAARTRDHYTALLERYLNPTFGSVPLDAITPSAVNLWFDAFAVGRSRKGDTGATSRAHTYALARAVMNTATGAHGPIVGQVNPFAVRGGGSTPSRKRTELATGEQVRVMLETIRPEWRLMILLGLWTGLRFSEIAELRRSDIDLSQSVIQVRRAVSRSRVDGVHAKGPKSEAGNRDLHVPAVVLDDLRKHLRSNVNGRDGLLFTGSNGQHLAPSTFYGKVTCQTCKQTPSACRNRQRGKAVKHDFAPRESGWYAARYAARCPELHFHDLRATGATLMAQQGATEAEIQAFLGDSTPQAAQRYVRAAQSRMKAHAERMNALAVEGNW